MAMTIEMVRDWAAKTPASNGWQAKERDDAVAALTAHLTQPAQAVDVEMRRACDVALLFCETGAMRTGWSPDRIRSAFEKLRVLGNANGKEGVVRDFTEEVDVDGKATGYLIFEHTTPPMLPDEVRKAVEVMDLRFTSSNEISVERASIRDHEWATIKAHLLAREAEVERLQAIEKERWDVVATRNASVMRAERAEALLRECLTAMELHPATHARITAHLSENGHG